MLISRKIIFQEFHAGYMTRIPQRRRRTDRRTDGRTDRELAWQYRALRSIAR